jgi:predicted DNA-binding ribbon-helix-helix protein
MRRSTSGPQSRARLLQKRNILDKRRNHWEIVFDHLIATPPEDRIGDLPEAIRQLNSVYRQLAALDRVLGIHCRTSRPLEQWRREMRSQIVKHSIVIAGRKTSVSLEDAFWRSFRDIADQRQITLSQLAMEIGATRTSGSLSSAIRLFVLALHRERLSEQQKQLARSTSPNAKKGHQIE